MEAVVRVEGRGLGTGFIVSGNGAHYVVTATHVVYGSSDAARGSCLGFDEQVKLIRRGVGGEPLTHARCAWNVGSDISLIKLSDRDGGYPALRLAARDMQRLDRVHPAGFPRGYDLDTAGAGNVRIVSTPDGMVVTTSLTMEGFSGGPYLADSGTVIGIHHGGVAYRGGFAHFVPVSRARSLLEALVGPIKSEQPPTSSAERFANTAAEEASLGRIAALQDVPPERRVQVWKVFTGREPDQAELVLIRALPTEAATTRGRELFGPDAQLVSRADVAERLSTASTLASLSCDEELMSIRGGVLFCGDRSRLYLTPNAGGGNTPNLIVLHYTATPNLTGTVRFLVGQQQTPRTSAHVLIDRDGTFVQLLPFDRVAWHVGGSRYQGTSNLNRRSVGIELINLGQLTRTADGRYHSYFEREVPENEVQAVRDGASVTYWHRFTGAQIATAEVIARKLAELYRVHAIIGHCNTTPHRKLDPGPAFPLARFGTKVTGGPGVSCPRQPTNQGGNTLG